MTFKQFIESNQINKLFSDDVIITFYHYDGCEVSSLTFDYKANIGNALRFFNDKVLNSEILNITPYSEPFINALEFLLKED